MHCQDISVIDLPTIDLSPSKMKDPDLRKEEMDKLIQSFTTVGFCLITGIDQEGYNADEVLESIKWFFHDVSPEDKVDQLATKTFNSKNKNLYRGYFPMKHGGLSHKEGYDISKPKSEDVLQVGNPFLEPTPKLCIKGQEKNIEQFYKASNALQNSILITNSYKNVAKIGYVQAS